MWVQPHLRPQQASEFFGDQESNRPVVPGTVARGQAKDDDAFYTGRVAGGYVTAIPIEHAMADLKIKDYKDFILRGQERFSIYCTPCHGTLGDGKGMIAQRGFAIRRPPASYHTDRLRKMAIGHFYDVMTNGYGTMFSYAARVTPADRWAIAAYIRTLQLSQYANAGNLDTSERALLDRQARESGQK
jgi:mono/diheme cytochrome c family protein